MSLQVELVSGDLVLNRGDPEWWSFYDLDISDSHGCGKFPGPMAIIISEETPRKFNRSFITTTYLVNIHESRQNFFSSKIWSNILTNTNLSILFAALEGIIGETLSKFSIWGLYITFVLAVGRFIRLQCSDLRMRIPFENLPSCDRYPEQLAILWWMSLMGSLLFYWEIKWTGSDDFYNMFIIVDWWQYVKIYMLQEQEESLKWKRFCIGHLLKSTALHTCC